MRIKSHLFVAIAALLLVSCTSDNNTSAGNEANVQEGVMATVAPFEFDNTTRSTLYFDKDYGMQFKWNNSDEITVLPGADEEGSVRGIYNLTSGGGSPKAHFKCSLFQLKEKYRYFAFSMKERTTPSVVRISDKSNITVDYSGQRQLENGTGENATAHLGQYDFMVSTGVCPEGQNDHVDFDFKHLGLTMYVIITGLPENAKYRKLEIYDSKNTYRQPVRQINLTNGLSVDGKTYNPYFNAEDIQSETYRQSPRFSLFLGQDTNNNNVNSDDEGITVGSDGKLDLFVELPPVDMRNNTFIFTLEPSDGGKPYYMKCDGDFYKRQFLAGYAYMMSGAAQEVTTFEVSLKINHDWQLGSTLSRATGDPGVEDHFEKPNYIYYVYCVGGKVQAVNEKPFNRVPAIPTSGSDTPTIPTTDWLTSSDKVFDTYQRTFTFTVSNEDKDKVKNVYFVASMEDISSSFSEISAGDDESNVQALLYSIPAKRTEPVETDAEYQTRSQTFLKNLYSTPWSTQATFVGSLKDPYQDVILYHTAAKVDLKWNSNVSVIDNDHTTVSVNNVQSTNLSLFQPATVNGTTNHTGTNNYTVTSTIEEDRKFYGRQVFYLPQFATTTSPNTSRYNVTIGNKTAEDVDFSPATTNGFTSWLRWQKVY